MLQSEGEECVTTDHTNRGPTRRWNRLRHQHRIRQPYRIDDLSQYAEDPTADPFGRAGEDLFPFCTPCNTLDACDATLISDGSGIAPRWYVDSVAVSGDFFLKAKWAVVERWLAVDEPSRSLNATLNFCIRGGVGRGK